MSDSAEIMRLARETLYAYDEHIAAAEVEWSRTLNSDTEFLWCRDSTERAASVLKGKTTAEMWASHHPFVCRAASRTTGSAGLHDDESRNY